VVFKVRLVDAGIDARFVVDGADARGATFASVDGSALTALGSLGGSVDGSVRGAGDSLDATGAAIGADAGAAAGASAATRCAGAAAGAMMRSANA
jgi:hypothetical protein